MINELLEIIQKVLKSSKEKRKKDREAFRKKYDTLSIGDKIALENSNTYSLHISILLAPFYFTFWATLFGIVVDYGLKTQILKYLPQIVILVFKFYWIFLLAFAIVCITNILDDRKRIRRLLNIK